MRQRNDLRETVESGGRAFGARARTNSPIFVDVYGELGLDFVWIDTEHTGHSPLDSPRLQQYARAADAADVEVLVRLSSGDPTVVRKVLDAGLRNLVVPRVDTAAEVRRAVRASRFSYDGGAGERGVGGSYPNDWGADFDGYPDQQDDTVFVGALIETRDGIENVEEILAVPDLGFVFLGPADLSVSMGHPLEPGAPDVQAALDRAREATLDAGVPFGGFASSATEAAAVLEEGAQLVQIGDEIAAARTALGDRLDAVRDA